MKHPGLLSLPALSIYSPARSIDELSFSVPVERPRTQEAGGAEFDWTRVTGKIMQVHHAERRPSDAFVAVSYRGHWWYIDDTDLDSKSTFSFLSQTVELLSNDVRAATPVMTLPISAG